MKKRYYLFLFSLWIPMSAVAQIDYATDINPILVNNCNSCHSNGENSFRSNSYAGVMASVSPANRYNKNHVIPNDADGSPLVDKIQSANPQHGSRMPLGGQLTTDEINKIRQWINEGANEVATSNEEEKSIITDFKLTGNYPNPFNPTTQIRFESPVATQYTLSVFSINGQLISEQMGNSSAGITNVEVQFSDQPSGMYIYRLKAMSNGQLLFSGNGKMTLVK